MLHRAVAHSFCIKAVDIDKKDFEAMMIPDPAERLDLINKNETYRIDTIANNILKLYRKGEGVIFVCGALHAENLIKKLTKEVAAEHLLYYFPHADKRYDECMDDVKELLSNDTLKDHAFCLRNRQDHTLLLERIMKDVKMQRSGYISELIDGTASSRVLSNYFKSPFKVFLRPGHYVDAILKSKTEAEQVSISKKLAAASIAYHTLETKHAFYMIIPEINIEKVAYAIRCLK